MVISVFGLGFVGLTTALGLAEFGHTVYGIEINKVREDAIASGCLPFMEPGLDDALQRHLNKTFILCSDLKAALSQSEAIFYCVNTSQGDDGQADLTCLFQAIEHTLEVLDTTSFKTLVIKSTIPPATAEKKIVPFIESKGYTVGQQFGVANNPEFLREGHCWDDFIGADRIVLGTLEPRSEAILRQIYAPWNSPICCVNPTTAEYIKYLSNTLLATLISFANEASIAADAIGNIDAAEAFRVLHLDRRWGGCEMKSYVYPGCGFGGYCLPKDTRAFYETVCSVGYDPHILKNVIKVNDDMPSFFAQRIIRSVNENKSAIIGILGLSFKPDSDDVRDTPSARIIRELNNKGYCSIIAYDPVAMDNFKKSYDLFCSYADNFAEIAEKSDIFVITTAWPEFAKVRNYRNKPVVDCRYML